MELRPDACALNEAGEYVEAKGEQPFFGSNQ